MWVFATAAAMADPNAGPYLSLGDASAPTAGLAEGWGNLAPRLEFDPGAAISLTGGYAFQGGLRGEVQWSYQPNLLGQAASAAATGRFQGNAVFGNVLYNFDDTHLVDGFPSVSPHVGLGAGLANLRLGDTTNPLGYLPSNGGGSTFAYQAMIGFDAPFDGVRVGLNYRFTGTGDSAARSALAPGGLPPREHDFMLTLRYDFGSPRAPAAADSAPPKP